MRGWSWYWARLWEPAARGSARRRAQPQRDPGTERVPPGTARRALGRRGGRLRAAAAARLQPLLGNRAVAQAAGAPLPERERLGAAYGEDLSDVRVAVDPVATAAAGARAFATGDQIVIDSAAPGPDLLAEEAAHVVQARRRGTSPGISERRDAAEGQARAAAAAAAGRGAAMPDLSAGGPVAAVQRQEAAAGPGAGVLFPDAVRMMLAFQHSAQGSEGPLEWTPKLEAEFARLMPSTDMSAIRRLFDPPPPTPGIAFQRMVDAGLFPTLIAPPPERAQPGSEPEPPAPEPEPEPEDEAAAPEPPVGAEPERPGLEVAGTPFRAGIVGLHLQVGTPPPLPPEAVAARPFLERGIRLNDDQLGGILAGQAQAARQFDALLGVVPGLDATTRLAVAEWMAELALSNAVRAQARAEMPSALEESAAATAGFPVPRPPSVLDVLPSGGPMRQMLDLVDGIGFTVTIHFDL